MANRKEPRDVMELEHRDASERSASRPVVRGAQGIAAAGHYLTAMSAMRMLLSGGNAFDAAAAAGFAAAVVEPTASYSLCTEGSFMLYHSATGRVQALSGQGVAPGKATVDFFQGKGLDKIPTGPGPNAELSFTVPGVVDALLTMLETYGMKTVGEVMAPAMEYAQGGFPMYAQMRRSLQSEVALEQFHRYPPGGTKVFYPGGQPLQEGELLVQAQLAATLLQMVEGASRAGDHRQAGIQAARDVFYRGDIARTIVACSQRVGGLFSLEDLAEYHARLEDPLRTTFMGHEVCARSTWTQGALLLQALNILEHFDLRVMGHNSVQYIHTVAEALKLAWQTGSVTTGTRSLQRSPPTVWYPRPMPPNGLRSSTRGWPVQSCPRPATPGASLAWVQRPLPLCPRSLLLYQGGTAAPPIIAGQLTSR